MIPWSKFLNSNKILEADIENFLYQFGTLAPSEFSIILYCSPCSPKSCSNSRTTNHNQTLSHLMILQLIVASYNPKHVTEVGFVKSIVRAGMAVDFRASIVFLAKLFHL